MEYGYCVAFDHDGWRVRLLRNGVNVGDRRYPFEDDESCKRAYEQAMLVGHLYVMSNLFLPYFSHSCDPLLKQAIQTALSDLSEASTTSQ